MIYIVTAENRHLYRHALMEMHLQRKRLFVDEMKWALDATTGIEIDAYDAEDATYLIEAAAPRAPVAASVRLLPTHRPHLMSEVFSHLCPNGVPRSERIWEASRFCPAPETPKGEPRRALLAHMIAGIMETALLFGIERVTFVAGAALAPLALKVGWRAEALGPARRCGRERVTAIMAHIDAEGLRDVRARNGLAAPVTRFTAGDVSQAA